MPIPTPLDGSGVRPGSQPSGGVCWPAQMSTGLSPPIESGGIRIGASAPAGGDRAGMSDVLRFQNDMTAVRRQLNQLLDGQAEMQVAMLRLGVGGNAFYQNDSVYSTAQTNGTTPMNLDKSEVLAPHLKVRPVLPKLHLGSADLEFSTPTSATSERKDNKVGQRAASKASLPSESPLGLRSANASLFNTSESGSPMKHIKTDKEIMLSQEITKKREILKMFSVAEAEQAKLKAAPISTWKTAMRSQENQETTLDIFMGGVICLNAIFIGLSMDHSASSGEEWSPWLVADAVFLVTFFSEVTVKLRWHGFRGFFCGSQWFSNSFDATLILIDLVQLIVEVFFVSTARNLDALPSASLFRCVRVLKLGRMLRILQADVFKDLVDMLMGIIGGLGTLGWALVLYILVVYVFSLVFRELLGRHEYENIKEYFDSVPRAMFTTFRCSFGDCASITGIPIFEQVTVNYGAPCSMLYFLFMFAVTVGLFNVISAIFVESTMAAANATAAEKKRARLADEQLLFIQITKLIERILEKSPSHHITPPFSEALDMIYQTEVDRDVIDEVVLTDKIAIQALNELDILPQDRARLSDIFDPDNGGTIQVVDIAAGIRRLRGDPRRSDIVCVDLMIRAMQPVLAEIMSDVKSMAIGMHVPMKAMWTPPEMQP